MTDGLDEKLMANRARTARILADHKPDALIHWCARCGWSFTAGGARTIARGDPECHTRMTAGTVREAIASLEGET